MSFHPWKYPWYHIVTSPYEYFWCFRKDLILSDTIQIDSKGEPFIKNPVKVFYSQNHLIKNDYLYKNFFRVTSSLDIKGPFTMSMEFLYEKLWIYSECTCCDIIIMDDTSRLIKNRYGPPDP